MKNRVQSVIFNKSMWSTTNSEEWLKTHGFKTSFYKKGVDITPNYYRYRQIAPHHFKGYITKDLKNGIQLIIGV